MSNGLRDSIWANSSNRSHVRWNSARSSSVPPASYNDFASAAPSVNATSSRGTANGVNNLPDRPPPPAYAQPSPAAAPPSSRIAPKQAFHRFEQVCQRIRWKYIDLRASYDRALNPEANGFTQLDAERNFKVDFHEFYAWIEQALLFLLKIFNTMVLPGQGGPSGHAFHHNVLRALEDPESPLYNCLGEGEVIAALWKAKELRNRWKDEKEGTDVKTTPLKMYDLGWLVETILQGLEKAYQLAGSSVYSNNIGTEAQQYDPEVEEGWEWMTEPMDWEA